MSDSSEEVFECCSCGEEFNAQQDGRYECPCGENCCDACVRYCVCENEQIGYYHIDVTGAGQSCSKEGCIKCSICDTSLKECFLCDELFCDEHVNQCMDEDGESVSVCISCQDSDTVFTCLACDEMVLVSAGDVCEIMRESFCPKCISTCQDCGGNYSIEYAKECNERIPGPYTKCSFVDCRVIACWCTPVSEHLTKCERCPRKWCNEHADQLCSWCVYEAPDVSLQLVNMSLNDSLDISNSRRQSIELLTALNTRAVTASRVLSMNFNGGGVSGETAVGNPERRRILGGGVLGALTPDIVLGQESPWLLTTLLETHLKYFVHDRDFRIHGGKDVFVMWDDNLFVEVDETPSVWDEVIAERIVVATQDFLQRMGVTMEEVAALAQSPRLPGVVDGNVIATIIQAVYQRTAFVVLQCLTTGRTLLAVSVHGHSIIKEELKCTFVKAVFAVAKSLVLVFEEHGVSSLLIGGDFNVDVEVPNIRTRLEDIGIIFPFHLHSTRRTQYIDYIFTDTVELIRGDVKAANLHPLPPRSSTYHFGANEYCLHPPPVPPVFSRSPRNEAACALKEIETEDIYCWSEEQWKPLAHTIQENSPGNLDIVHSVALAAILDHDPMVCDIIF